MKKAFWVLRYSEMHKLLTEDSEALSTIVDRLLVGRMCNMHKGTKLGPRDYWQTKINYNKRVAFEQFQKLQVLQDQLANLKTEDEIKKLKERIDSTNWSYRYHLADFHKWSERQKYGGKNLRFIAPYIKKHGERAGFIYVLRTLEENPVYKIGKTRSLLSRTHSYNSARGKNDKPVEFIMLEHTEECDIVERLLLEIFKHKRVRGYEWFSFSPEDIDQLKKYFRWTLNNRK